MLGNESQLGFLQLLVILQQLIRANFLDIFTCHVHFASVFELNLADFCALPVKTPNYSFDCLFGYFANHCKAVDVCMAIRRFLLSTGMILRAFGLVRGFVRAMLITRSGVLGKFVAASNIDLVCF